MSDTPEVLIIGAGLAGLTCARRLQESNVSFELLEATDSVGGRVKTDSVDGFLLDRGFQVFLTAYPEAQRWLDYEALELKRFEPGALVWHDGRFHRLSDPLRKPGRALETVFSGVGTFSDKLRTGALRFAVTRGPYERRFDRPEQATVSYLREKGFSEPFISRFFRPFLGGIFLDSSLQTSSRMFEFVFRMFSQGDGAIPGGGMQQIPEQLAAPIPGNRLRLGARVARLDGTSVTLDSGDTLRANAVVLAVEKPAASKLLNRETPIGHRSVTCLYFSAGNSPLQEPVLLLNGEQEGPVNNVAVLSDAAPEYAPDGKSLISVTVPDRIADDGEDLETRVRRQLQTWFGSSVAGWTHLQSSTIEYALPSQTAIRDISDEGLRIEPGLYRCGDYLGTASINDAMRSGRRAAELVIADLKKERT